MEFKTAFVDFSKRYDTGSFGPTPDDDLGEPNIRTSERPDGTGHYLFLDLDVPHEYVPSSTEGHGHLVVDVSLGEDAMFEVLGVLAKHGVVQLGWVAACAARGAATLRLPGVKKEGTTT